MVYRLPYYKMEGNGCIMSDKPMTLTGIFDFSRPKSYSIIATNLETVEDVERVIRQCKLIKEQITSKSKQKGMKRKKRRAALKPKAAKSKKLVIEITNEYEIKAKLPFAPIPSPTVPD